MTHLDNLFIDALHRLTGSSSQLLDRLWNEGLIDSAALERRIFVREVESLEWQGLNRHDAIACVAERYCCSFWKVRNCIYGKAPAAEAETDDRS